MDHLRLRRLATRFIAEAEADINYGLAEGLDPHHEYKMLVARLNAEAADRPEADRPRRDLAVPADQSGRAGVRRLAKSGTRL